MSFKAKLSENGTEVIMTDTDGKSETLLLNEFVALFGTDILNEYYEANEQPTKEPSILQVQEYYDAISEVIRVNEEIDAFTTKYHYAVKAIRLHDRRLKDCDINPLSNRIKNEKIHNIDVEYMAMRKTYRQYLEIMNYWARVVGVDTLPSNKSLFPDLDGEISLERFSHLLFSQDYFRDNMKKLIDKYYGQGLAISIYELAKEALETW